MLKLVSATWNTTHNTVYTTCLNSKSLFRDWASPTAGSSLPTAFQRIIRPCHADRTLQKTFRHAPTRGADWQNLFWGSKQAVSQGQQCRVLQPPTGQASRGGQRQARRGEKKAHMWTERDRGDVWNIQEGLPGERHPGETWQYGWHVDRGLLLR